MQALQENIKMKIRSCLLGGLDKRAKENENNSKITEKKIVKAGENKDAIVLEINQKNDEVSKLKSELDDLKKTSNNIESEEFEMKKDAIEIKLVFAEHDVLSLEKKLKEEILNIQKLERKIEKYSSEIDSLNSKKEIIDETSNVLFSHLKDEGFQEISNITPKSIGAEFGFNFIGKKGNEESDKYFLKYSYENHEQFNRAGKDEEKIALSLFDKNIVADLRTKVLKNNENTDLFVTISKSVSKVPVTYTNYDRSQVPYNFEEIMLTSLITGAFDVRGDNLVVDNDCKGTPKMFLVDYLASSCNFIANPSFVDKVLAMKDEFNKFYKDTGSFPDYYRNVSKIFEDAKDITSFLAALIKVTQGFNLDYGIMNPSVLKEKNYSVQKGLNIIFKKSNEASLCCVFNRIVDGLYKEYVTLSKKYNYVKIEGSPYGEKFYETADPVRKDEEETAFEKNKIKFLKNSLRNALMIDLLIFRQLNTRILNRTNAKKLFNDFANSVLFNSGFYDFETLSKGIDTRYNKANVMLDYDDATVKYKEDFNKSLEKYEKSIHNPLMCMFR